MYNSYASGDVTVSWLFIQHAGAQWYVGGLIGLNDGGRVQNTYAVGNVDIEGDSRRSNGVFGGLIGASVNGTLMRGYAIGSVNATGYLFHAGGVLGRSNGDRRPTSLYYNRRPTSSTENVSDIGVSRTLEELVGGRNYFHQFDSADWRFYGVRLPILNSTTTGQILNGQLHTRPRSLYGSGTANDPWLIDNATALQSIATGHSSNHPGGADVTETQAIDGHYRLTNNINLSQAANFTPIGNSHRSFTGRFDGNARTISNLGITTSSGDAWGLFGIIGRSAVVHDLILLNPQITVNGNAVGHAGGIAGVNRGIVRDCTVRGGRVINTYSNSVFANYLGRGSAGGMVGLNENRASIINSRVTGGIGEVTVGSGDNLTIGGLVGKNSGRIFESSADRAHIVGDFRVDTGGLIGLNEGTVEKSFAQDGSVKAYEHGFAGGLMGEMLAYFHGWQIAIRVFLQLGPIMVHELEA